MKKILIMTICILGIYIRGLKAQVVDTSAYLQQIVANKNCYIGKTFSVLEKELKIKVKYFYPLTQYLLDINKETSTFFRFINPSTELDFSTPKLIIKWRFHLNASISDSLYIENDGGMWTAEVEAFYSKGIIADIETR